MGKLPNARKKPGALGMTPQVQEAEGRFYRCPKGHKLPNKTARGECTPIWCADTEGALGSRVGTSTVSHTKNARKAGKEATEAALVATDGEVDKVLDRSKVPDSHKELVKVQAEDQRSEQLAKTGAALGRKVARQALLDMPQNLKGADAEKWSDEKIVEMLPLAVAEVQYQLEYGDDGQRMKAAEKILDATGRGKRDGGGGATSPIVMINIPGGFSWRKPVPNGPVIDALPPGTPEDP